MTKKISLKTEIAGAIDMAKSLVPKFTSLLNPQVWQSPETISAGIVSLATGFVAERIQKIFGDISKHTNINTEILESSKSKHLLIDLAKFAAQENPDEEVWDAVKKIFIQTLKKEVQTEERASLYELINICKELQGTEIRIIAGAYILKNKVGYDSHHSVLKWATDLSQEIGLTTPEEVLRYEDNLVKQKLIVTRESLRGDVLDTWIGSGANLGHRLTKLGVKLAESLQKETK